MEQMKKVIIAGGGTGGHVYPGLAIAKELLKQDPSVKVEFVGTEQGMEKNIIPREGFKLHFVRSAKLNNLKGIFAKIKALTFVLLGLIDSFRLVLELKPDYVLGVGGYASGPFMLMAFLMGKKTAIWEPNAMPGMANRILSSFVPKAFLVFDESKNKLKSKNTFVLGMPIREEIEQSFLTPKAESHSSEVFSILIFCGSQGARLINNMVIDMIGKYLSDFSNVHFYHQIGQANFSEAQKKYGEILDKNAGTCDRDKNIFYFSNNLQVQIFDFIYNMPELYNKSSMVICRGGASSVAEVAANRLPALIIPLAAADNHQEKNAEQFVKQNAAQMVLQKDLDIDKLKNILMSFKNDSQKIDTYRKNVGNLFKPQAGKEISRIILNEI